MQNLRVENHKCKAFNVLDPIKQCCHLLPDIILTDPSILY